MDTETITTLYAPTDTDREIITYVIPPMPASHGITIVMSNRDALPPTAGDVVELTGTPADYSRSFIRTPFVTADGMRGYIQERK